MIRQLKCVGLLVLALATATGGAEAQSPNSGIITGRVVSRVGDQPIVGVNVVLVGSQRGARTDETGVYRIANVEPGTVQIRAFRIGFEAETREVVVAAGQPATADFALAATAIHLDEVTITATGEQQRVRENGASVAKITAEDLPIAATPNLASMLNARSAGVTVVQNGGTTGTAQRIRIRGMNSVSLSNDPLLIIDGVRVNSSSNSFSIGLGGQTTSRLDDINPNDIESIETLKGPAASALYGTAAANGVIQITTKKGRAGKARWNTYAEQGTIRDVAHYPSNYGSVGSCGRYGFLADVAAGTCTQTSLLRWNPLEDASPLRNGTHQRYGAGINGGNDLTQYFISADQEFESGVYKFNDLSRLNLRTNLNASFTPKITSSISLGYVKSGLGLPQNDNNNLGILSGGLLGNPTYDAARLGYLTRRPDSLYALRSNQDVDRFTGGLNTTYNPLSFIRIVGSLGYDALNRHDTQTLPANRITNNTNNRNGSRSSNVYQIFNYTANLSGTATANLTQDIVSTTTAGTQFRRDEFTGTQGFGRVLVAGTETLAGTATLFSVGEDLIDNRTIGFLGSEQLAWRDRLFVTGTIRGDKNSAFGQKFGFARYPAVSASYVIGDEPFFPKSYVLSSLRLRTAYGTSGLQPGSRDAEYYYAPVSANIRGVENAALTPGNLGNSTLKPEIAHELEAGFDAGMLGDRASLEVTYYDKHSRDALISRTTPPSAPTVSSRYENLGSVRNNGLETTLNLKLLTMPDYQWTAALNGSWTKNRLIKLGNNISPIIFGLGGNTQEHQEGFALGSYWAPTYTYSDANKDGIIGYDEVTVASTATYQGTILPTREFSLNTNLTLFKWVQLFVNLDHKGGFKQYNATEEFRCSSFYNCRSLYDHTASLADQARAIAATGFAQGNPSGTVAGYMEKADFTKLREVALTFSAPEHWASMLRSDGLSLTISGRNLYTWTKYTGFDPEVISSQANFSTFDFFAQPPVRNFTARLNVNF